MSDKLGPIEQLMVYLKEDLETMFGECKEEDGIFRSLAENLGVTCSGALIEADIEGLENGDGDPYPAIYFHITLAKEVDKENFPRITDMLNDINVALSVGEYPAFGTFCLYKPLKQIFYSYRMPINIGSIEDERENIRYFIASVLNQLDIFVDLMQFVSSGVEDLKVDRYIQYIKDLADLNDLKERTEALSKMLEEFDVKFDVAEDDPE